MSAPSLLALADEAGLAAAWSDAEGRPRRVAADVLRTVLGALDLPAATPAQIVDSRRRLAAERACEAATLVTSTVGRPTPVTGIAAGAWIEVELESGRRRRLRAAARRGGGATLPALDEPGYHRVAGGDRQFTLAVAPRRAPGVAELTGRRRAWGIAAQVYALRRDGDGGVGDFTALAAFARQSAREGAHAVAVSPLHALFAAAPERFGPYAPSNRCFLNVLHVDAGVALPAPRGDGDLVDWPAVARAKLAVLRATHRALGGTRRDAFERFRRRGGEALEDHARFEAIDAQLRARGVAASWRDWPDGLADSRGAAVTRFARAHAREVEFYAFLQFLAAGGLARAQRAARDAGMGIGLIADLAVGTDPAGSHAWSRPGELLVGLEVGAPPDPFNRHGQTWGLTTFSPRALRTLGFAPFLDTLRAALRHAGGVRIDHALGLARIWVVPQGASARDGVYLALPGTDLLRLIALEAHRHQALIVGEDLGTVPAGLRGRLDSHGILGMRVLWFERDRRGFLAPGRWTRRALAMTTTHDLPTVAGWWRGIDLGWRDRVGARLPRQQRERKRERAELWRALRRAGTARGSMPAPTDAAPVVDAAIGFVARTRSALALVPLEDVLALDQQPNLPGTIDQHPNWRRRMPAAPDLLALPAPTARLARLRRARGGR